MIVVRSWEMKIDASELLLASLARTYYKLSECFWKDYTWQVLLSVIWNDKNSN